MVINFFLWKWSLQKWVKKRRDHYSKKKFITSVPCSNCNLLKNWWWINGKNFWHWYFQMLIFWERIGLIWFIFSLFHPLVKVVPSFLISKLKAPPFQRKINHHLPSFSCNLGHFWLKNWRRIFSKENSSLSFVILNAT